MMPIGTPSREDSPLSKFSSVTDSDKFLSGMNRKKNQARPGKLQTDLHPSLQVEIKAESPREMAAARSQKKKSPPAVELPGGRTNARSLRR